MKTTKRDLLKGLAVGSAWSAPVVSNVLLPAHAATTMLRCVTQDDEQVYNDCFCPNWDDLDGFNACLAEAGLRTGDDCVFDFITECPSDFRLKTDIHPLGSTPHGLRLYRYRYLEDESQSQYVGVMAQDLLESHPEAVVKGPDGYFKVRYASLGLKMVTLAEWEKEGLESVCLH